MVQKNNVYENSRTGKLVKVKSLGGIWVEARAPKEGYRKVRTDLLRPTNKSLETFRALD